MVVLVYDQARQAIIVFHSHFMYVNSSIIWIPCNGGVFGQKIEPTSPRYSKPFVLPMLCLVEGDDESRSQANLANHALSVSCVDSRCLV